ncbi:MAG: sigma-54 dependent transcriptional regulator [Gemmatimonadota bacterium]
MNRQGALAHVPETEAQDVSRVHGRILVVDDAAPMRTLLEELLTDAGYEVVSARTGEEALQIMQRDIFDVVLLDYSLPGIDGISVMMAAPNTQTDAEIIMMTAFADIETAVQAMRLGAFDYREKPLEPEELLLIIQRARERTELRRELAQLRREVPRGPRSRMIGKSRALGRVFDLIERVAPTRATVLVTGETGTGKELVARAVHDLSPRAKKSFVPVNCSALPETLLESELFGHVKGSFTGAIASRRGLFEEASGGTLFLDELSTISPAIQAKLLRVLEDRHVQRVGGSSRLPVDFRLIGATNVDLAREVAEGRFREDLFFRLNVFPIAVPPLRDRKEDIPLLANYFRNQFADENQVKPPEIPPETYQRMMDYEWPGNVRELQSFIERAMIIYAGSESIRFDPPIGSSSIPEHRLLELGRGGRWSVERLEREQILSVLESTSGNQTKAAQLLGMDRRTLYRKLKKYAEDADS